MKEDGQPAQKKMKFPSKLKKGMVGAAKKEVDEGDEVVQPETDDIAKDDDDQDVENSKNDSEEVDQKDVKISDAFLDMSMKQPAYLEGQEKKKEEEKAAEPVAKDKDSTDTGNDEDDDDFEREEDDDDRSNVEDESTDKKNPTSHTIIKRGANN